MREPGAILLISCYELGHQPLSLASPLAVLRQAGYEPLGIDTSVEVLSNDAIAHARFVGISVPMHTAMRLGVHVAERVRAIDPEAHICFYGLYATLNADYLLQRYADSVISGEYERPLLELVQALERGEPACIERAGDRNGNDKPYITKIPFTVPDRASLPSLEHYARFRSDGTFVLAGYVETSRGDARAGADGDAHVGLHQGRCVVDAVTHHGDPRAFRLQLADLFDFFVLLTYVHTSLQPRIDALFAQAAGNPVPQEFVGPQ